MRSTPLLILSLGAAQLIVAGTQTTKPAVASSSSKSNQTKTANSTPVHSATRTGNHAVSAHTARTRSRSARTRRKPAPSYQLHPDADRYREIQQALADRGYFKGEVDGTWGDDSVESLKRFQADQKLPDDGKISALTLSGLGLGPKHNAGNTNPTAAQDAGSTPASNTRATGTAPASKPPTSQVPPEPPR